jgi:hypothetical protein
MPSASTQRKSISYEPPAINFHLEETPPREPQGEGSTPCAWRLFCLQLNGISVSGREPP